MYARRVTDPAIVELSRAGIAIDAERAQLAVLAIARDTARSDERELVTAIDALTAELP